MSPFADTPFKIDFLPFQTLVCGAERQVHLREVLVSLLYATNQMDVQTGKRLEQISQRIEDCLGARIDAGMGHFISVRSRFALLQEAHLRGKYEINTKKVLHEPCG